jgi:hypothetical protein
LDIEYSVSEKILCHRKHLEALVAAFALRAVDGDNRIMSGMKRMEQRQKNSKGKLNKRNEETAEDRGDY